MEQIIENRRLNRWTALPRSPLQIGAIHEADAELVPLPDGRLLALTVDTVAEEVVLGLYRDPFTVGRTAAVAALSDLAAVGADPIGLLLAVSLPPAADQAWLQQRIARGVSSACRAAGTFVLGGDTNSAARLSVGCTACGTIPHGAAITRRGTRPGDRVYASGPLGAGAALAAAILLDLPHPTESDWCPPVRIAQGRALRGLASACMDTSDGLLTTLDQLGRLNNVAIRITRPLEALLEPGAARLRHRLGLSAFPLLAGQHGEYELAFTVPDYAVPRLLERAEAMDWRPLELGRVERGTGLFAGDHPIDGTWLRNLLERTGGDLQRYVHELCAADATTTTAGPPPDLCIPDTRGTDPSVL